MNDLNEMEINARDERGDRERAKERERKRENERTHFLRVKRLVYKYQHQSVCQSAKTQNCTLDCLNAHSNTRETKRTK